MRTRVQRHLRPIGEAIASLILLLVLLIAVAPPASANIEPSTYQITLTRLDSTTGGGYASCPAGTKIVTGGADTKNSNSGFFGILGSSTPTFDGNGWYAAGTNPPGTQMRILLRCVPAAQLADTTLLTTRLSVHENLPPIFSTFRACPPGTTIYGGGGFFHKPATAPDPHDGGQMYASMPSGNGWFFGAFNSTSYDMTLSARCLPNTQIPDPVIKTVTKTFTPTGASAGAFVPCPTGLRAYSGGAWWHSPTSTTPSFWGTLKTSLPLVTSGGDGWYAEGLGSGQLSVTVRCTPG